MTRRRHTAVAASAVAAVCLGASLLAAPAASAAPDRTDYVDTAFYTIGFPYEEPLLALINTSRDELCDGDPSPTGGVPGRITVVGSGNEVVHQRGDVGVEMWRLRPGWTYENMSADPCDDIVGAAPQSAGDVTFTYLDNDGSEAGVRTNAFRTSLRGTLAGDDGRRWAFALLFRDVVHPDGTAPVSYATFSLTPKGR
jgi:hypothetical protein